ncbi:HSF5 protein, partial [Centropus unirufus]|nr:HSF5 protein [Centropus unirufus]
PGSVNPDAFPAKLWRLVNSPSVTSVRWDARGEGLLILQPRFERELLGAGPPGQGPPAAPGVFRTRSFASFVRQLNLYGFHKVLPAQAGAAPRPAGDLHHFQSPYFRRDRPDLLARLQRLTKAKRAKLAAALEPPDRSQRPLGSSH